MTPTKTIEEVGVHFGEFKHVTLLTPVGARSS